MSESVSQRPWSWSLARIVYPLEPERSCNLWYHTRCAERSSLTDIYIYVYILSTKFQVNRIKWLARIWYGRNLSNRIVLLNSWSLSWRKNNSRNRDFFFKKMVAIAQKQTEETEESFCELTAWECKYQSWIDYNIELASGLNSTLWRKFFLMRHIKKIS